VSIENLKKYGELCAKDERVRARAKEIGIQDADGQIAYGKSLGLEFSREDFEALAKEIGLDGKSELSEEELKKVAGGVWTLSTVVMVAACATVSLVGTATLINKPRW
jgi:predicted ribosomally synthesized peptide with nif11-like leader